MPRFVLLRHECPPGFSKPSHWDFMLEVEGVLQTWELRELPAPWEAAIENGDTSIAASVAATRLADHRLTYLDYEGPLTGDRGNVTRVATGEYTVIENPAGRLVVSLHGDRIDGTIELAEVAETGDWQLTVCN